MATKAVKTKKARNAYELLDQVCRAIKDNPLNYYQAWWKSTKRNGFLPNRLDTPANHCGTAFCRAGWVVAIHDGPKARPSRWGLRATEILGVDAIEADALYDGACVIGTPGTRDYVREGVRGIRAFMARHEAVLKAKKVTPKSAA